ncbi:MAG TPA: RecT family recombinase [Aliidongia sp.]|uniref:RecT family recombinase n=1 Tax=Aliidongia sp. TaxID=1914230 RepID=UPI002DDD335F|nr:RecT family recombinase [Aliidongia sp.]HEV2674103.1 RecT family recombinase [Aliidongia sp.]
MSVATITPPRSILITMATRYGMEPQAFEATVRATCMPAGNNQQPPTREEFAAFLLVANEHDLNPLTKEIFAYPKRGGGIQPIVSVDGWIKKVNQHPQFDGMEFREDLDDQKKLFSCTCTIWRKDRSRPTIVTEYLSECVRQTEPWKMANRMLRHKALIQCARVAFGFAGIMDPDEAEKIIDISPGAQQAVARPQRSDFVDNTAPSYPTLTIIDEHGEIAGEWPAPRAIAMLGGLMRGKSDDVIVAVFEHNEDALAQMAASNISIGELEDLYQSAIKAKDQATHAQATDAGKPDDFWRQPSLTIDPKPLGWKGWLDTMKARIEEACDISSLASLDHDNEANLAALNAKSLKMADELRDAFAKRQAAIMLAP